VPGLSFIAFEVGIGRDPLSLVQGQASARQKEKGGLNVGDKPLRRGKMEMSENFLLHVPTVGTGGMRGGRSSGEGCHWPEEFRGSGKGVKEEWRSKGEEGVPTRSLTLTEVVGSGARWG